MPVKGLRYILQCVYASHLESLLTCVLGKVHQPSKIQLCWASGVKTGLQGPNKPGDLKDSGPNAYTSPRLTSGKGSRLQRKVILSDLEESLSPHPLLNSFTVNLAHRRMKSHVSASWINNIPSPAARINASAATCLDYFSWQEPQNSPKKFRAWGHASS